MKGQRLATLYKFKQFLKDFEIAKENSSHFELIFVKYGKTLPFEKFISVLVEISSLLFKHQSYSLNFEEF